MKKYYVEIVAFNGRVVVARMDCYSRRDAEKVERGANINLNHEGYCTRIVESGGPDTVGEIQEA